MDWSRSCYSVMMLFRSGDSPLSVTWSFAEPSAGIFPHPHNFSSGNWDEKKLIAGQIGEQPGSRPWFTGTPIGRGQPTYLCVDVPAEWWLAGIPDGELAPPVDAAGVPECCTAWDCTVLPDSLHLTFTGDGVCSNIDGSAVVTRDPDTCLYIGEKETWLGTAGITVDTNSEPPTFAIDCFAGNPTVELVTYTRVPYSATWHVTDTAACCSFGESSFTVVMTV